MLSLEKKIKLEIKLLFNASLTTIAQSVGGDKFYGHNYISKYEKYFDNLRKKRLNILEIGIGGYDNPRNGGESLLMWSKYFKNSSILGADLFKKT